MVLTGAFLTGEPLQIRVAEYSAVQRRLGEDLKGLDGGWEYESLKWKDVGSYDTGGGYASLVPLVLMQRNGERLREIVEDMQGGRPRAELEWLQGAMRGWSWELREIGIELYDLGVGVVKGAYRITAPASLSVDEIRRTIESLGFLRPNPESGVRSPVAETYEALARETVDALSSAISRCAGQARQEPWLVPQLDALSTAQEADASGRDRQHEPSGNEWGRLLWLHPVYVLTGRTQASSASLERISRPFRATFSRCVEFPEGLFLPGIDSSTIVVCGEQPSRCGVPMKLLGLNWAYYALFMEMDRGLLATLDSDRWNAPGSLRALEHDSERIFETYMRVHEARARLDSALTDLGGGELSLWNAISDVAKFGDLAAAVDAKLEALQRIAERRVQEASANRARRTASVLSGLTALTVVTVAVAVMGNFIGIPADGLGHMEVRATVVLGAFLVALLLYREAQREIALKRRRTRQYSDLRI